MAVADFEDKELKRRREGMLNAGWGWGATTDTRKRKLMKG